MPFAIIPILMAIMSAAGAATGAAASNAQRKNPNYTGPGGGGGGATGGSAENSLISALSGAGRGVSGALSAYGKAGGEWSQQPDQKAQWLSSMLRNESVLSRDSNYPPSVSDYAGLMDYAR